MRHPKSSFRGASKTESLASSWGDCLRIAMPKRYTHISFKPPASVAAEAEKGLEFRRKSGKGGLTPQEAGKEGIGSGVQRAVNLKNRDNIAPDTIKQMLAFFSRHEKNKAIARENRETPWEDSGYVAWLLWGGDSGRSWAKSVKKKMDKADSQAKEAKYKSKKEVPRADGSGTTTVYEYGPRQIAKRHKEKAARIEALRKNMSELRRKAQGDLEAKDPETRLTALAVCLMDETYARIGNEKSAENGRHGVTTWTIDHATLADKTATIRYTGKSGVKQEKKISNSRVLTALRKALKGKSKGDKILCDGSECTILAKDVNTYLKSFDVTAKDIRGLHANEEMKHHLKKQRKDGPSLPHSRKEKDKILKAEFKAALELASAAVGHEPGTLRGQYLVPSMEESYTHDGTVLDQLAKTATLSDAEKEDREAERLVRRSPKYKPPRRDKERRIIQDEDSEDPDEKQDKKDRSNNYKDSSLVKAWGSLLTAADDPLRPGDVRRTDKGKFTAMNPDEAIHTFEEKEKADAFAKGEAAEKKKAPGKMPLEERRQDLASKRDSLMKEYADMGLLDSDSMEAISELAGEAKTPEELEEVRALAKEEAEKVEKEKGKEKGKEKAQLTDQQRSEIEKAEAVKAEKEKVEKAKKEVADIAGPDAGIWGILSGKTSEDLSAITDAAKEAFGHFLATSPSAEAQLNEVAQIISDGALKDRAKDLADKGDMEALGSLLGAAQFHRTVHDNPTVDLDDPLPEQGEGVGISKEKRVERSSKSFEKALKASPEDRKRHLEQLQKEIDTSTGSRKDHLTAVARGIGIASVIQDGDDAEGVAGATARLMRAAHKAGAMDKIHGLSPSGESQSDRESDQKNVRGIYSELRNDDWLEVVPDDHPGRAIAEMLSDPFGKGRFLSEDDKADLRNRLTDMMTAETSFLDSALTDSMGTQTVRKYDAEAKKHRTQAASSAGVLDIRNKPEKVKDWVSGFISKLVEGAAGLAGVKTPEAEKKPGEVWYEGQQVFSKSPEGETRQWERSDESLDKAKAWSKGETLRAIKNARWDSSDWGSVFSR